RGKGMSCLRRDLRDYADSSEHGSRWPFPVLHRFAFFVQRINFHHPARLTSCLQAGTAKERLKNLLFPA
ncbi:MAG: hypothetical protein ACK4RZ_17690, partial [Paracoccaceae bacterium]